jgi:hypothetical protein
MAPHSEDRDWMSIAEQVSEEKNPDRLMTLVGQLCSALENRKKAVVPLTVPLTSQTISQESSL